jgi:peptide/nickel transport system substrate-binding protein
VGGRNISLLSDSRFDKLLEDARQTTDQARRADLYRQFQELFAQEVPAIPLYSSASLYVQPSSVKGIRAGYLDNPGARFWQVQDWYVKTH